MSTPTHARRGRPAPSRGSDPPAHAGTVAEVLNEIEAATDRRTRRAMLPERNLVAALITLDRDRAAEVLSLVTTADFEDHLSAVIAALIRVIACERGEPPSPQAVFALTRSLGPKLTEFHVSENRIAQELTEVYTLGLPITVWSSARQVVEDSYRRRLGAGFTRGKQMCDTYADIPAIEAHITEAREPLLAHRERLITLTHRAATNTP
ncbi:hypothetical protein [Nocardia sp. NBC_00511]|uniref:hypothetical protein n=1 Tax=Nocardia sp. NBC_00511 TaxID=2903591 RepID=UPI002F91AEA5